MRRGSRIQLNQSVTDINISPLIDMMFLLLIFFIVTASFVDEVGVDIERPRAQDSQSLDKSSIMLGVSKSGTIHYNGSEIDPSMVQGLIRELIRAEKRPVIIVADEASRTGTLINVLDECRAAGADPVNVATEREK